MNFWHLFEFHFFSGGSKSTQTRQRSSAGKRRWSRSKFHAAMVEPLYHIVITVWYCKNRCYKKEINKNLVVPNPMPIRTPNFSINHDNLLFLILAAPKKRKDKKSQQICKSNLFLVKKAQVKENLKISESPSQFFRNYRKEWNTKYAGTIIVIFVYFLDFWTKKSWIIKEENPSKIS